MADLGGITVSSDDQLVKMVMFLFIQALVYLILCKSSTVFSGGVDRKARSFSRARSDTLRRILAVFSDVPFSDDEQYWSDQSFTFMDSLFLIEL